MFIRAEVCANLALAAGAGVSYTLFVVPPRLGGLGLGPPAVWALLSPGAPAASPSNLVADLRPRSVLCTVCVVTVPI